MRDFTELERVRFMSHVEKKENGCWLWVGARNEKGYGIVGLRGITTKAHRISYQMFVREISREECALHHCDNPPCCNPEHLFIGDRNENNQDMIRKGRYNRERKKRGYRLGENHQGNKFSDAVIRQVRRDRAKGMSYSKLAKKHSMNQAYCWNICRNLLRKEAGE